MNALSAGKFARGECCENVGTCQCTEALPAVCPLQVAADELREVTSGEVHVYGGDDHCREWVQDEGG
jgi:hypothetical protein